MYKLHVRGKYLYLHLFITQSALPDPIYDYFDRFSTREEPLGRTKTIILHGITNKRCANQLSINESVYLNGTPYVLREYTKPMQNIRAYYGMNSQRLEKMEERLKADVLKETGKFGGLILVHQELCKLLFIRQIDDKHT